MVLEASDNLKQLWEGLRRSCKGLCFFLVG